MTTKVPSASPELTAKLNALLGDNPLRRERVFRKAFGGVALWKYLETHSEQDAIDAVQAVLASPSDTSAHWVRDDGERKAYFKAINPLLNQANLKTTEEREAARHAALGVSSTDAFAGTRQEATLLTAAYLKARYDLGDLTEGERAIVEKVHGKGELEKWFPRKDGKPAEQAEETDEPETPHWSDDETNVARFWEKADELAQAAGIVPSDVKRRAYDVWNVVGLHELESGQAALNRLKAAWAKTPAPSAPPTPPPSVPAPRTEVMRAPAFQIANPTPEVQRWELLRQQAEILIRSGFLPNQVRTPEQAIAMIMMGEAIGVQPLVALNNINVISGKPTISPQLMLALVRRSGQLEGLRITDDGQTCTVVLQRRGEEPHTETFSMEDASLMKLASKENWRQQPATMRKWRAVSAACRVVFPDVIWGMYTPEELDPDYTYTEDGQS